MNKQSPTLNLVETQSAQLREMLIADARSKFVATLEEVRQEQEYFSLQANGPAQYGQPAN